MKHFISSIFTIFASMLIIASCSDSMDNLAENIKPNGLSRSIQNENNGYYYYRGEKIPLTINDSLSYVIYEDSDNDAHHSDVKQTHSRYGKILAKNEALKLLSDSQKGNGAKIIAIEDVINENTPLLNECYVKLHNIGDLPLLEKIAKEHGCTITPPDKYSALWAIVHTSLESDVTSLDMSNYLYETGLFEDTDPGMKVEIQECYVPSDPYYNTNQWNLKSVYTGIDMEQAWNYTKGNSSVKVAIFEENGINTSMTEFLGQFISESYDCHSNSEPANIYEDLDYPFHSTEVASIIAAKHNDEKIAGIAPSCKFMCISGAYANPAQIAKGFTYARIHGASVINCSWSISNGHPSSIITAAIDSALVYGRGGKGMIVCFSAGNHGVVEYPANSLPGIIVVGATDNNRNLCSFSGRGSALDLVAPGKEICVLTGNDGHISSNEGTSFSCPHVSGVAALMLSVNSDLTAAEVQDILKASATRVNSYYTYPNNNVGWGLLNAYRAVKLASKDYRVLTEYDNETNIVFPRTKYSIYDLPDRCTVSWHSLAGTYQREWNDGTEFSYDFSIPSLSEYITANISAGSYSFSINRNVRVFNLPKIRTIESFSAGLSDEEGCINLKALIALPNANVTWSMPYNSNAELIDFPYAGDAGYSDPNESYKSVVFRASGYYSIPVTVTASNTYGYDTKTYQVEFYCNTPSIMRRGDEIQ